jgi:tripartite-type tricarboxylate transporter receptor subunit TctC
MGKTHPAQANFGTVSGPGQHLADLIFARTAGLELPITPYKGGAAAVVDLMGGQIAATIGPLPEVLSYSRAGRLRILATMDASRARLTPRRPNQS